LLPLITEESRDSAINEIFQDMTAWRKDMIHHIKDKNPELNAAIIEVANKSELDPKALALGAYMLYRMLELAEAGEDKFLEDFIS
jgi:hypothetical protein